MFSTRSCTGAAAAIFNDLLITDACVFWVAPGRQSHTHAWQQLDTNDLMWQKGSV